MTREPSTATSPEAPPQVSSSPRARRVAMGVSIIALVALLQVGTQYFMGHERGRLFSHLVFALVELPLLMLTLSAVFRWATRRRLGAVPMVLGGVAIAAALGALLGLAVWCLAQELPVLRPRPDQAWKMSRALFFGLMYGQANFGLWALAFVFPFAVEDARIRSLEADKLRLEAEKLRTAAELARLRAHLEPHFLLNTLSAIAGLVTDDPREARRLLVCLGDLLRDALRDEGEMQTFEDQIAWLQRYAEILEARHPGHLAFRWQIAIDAKRVLLPRLLLQPLVENAVKHGALRRADGGEVIIRAEVMTKGGDPESSRLVCTVEDNGPGMPDKEPRSGAFGLHVVRRRLELKYLTQASLRLESSAAGTRSIVELPQHPAVALGGVA